MDDGEELKLQGEMIKRAKNFKYLGSTISSDGACEDVKEKDPSRMDELEEGVWNSVRQEVISKG